MSNAPAKRQRRKVLTDAGRALLNQQRQRLNREQAALGERIVNEAQNVQFNQARIDQGFKPEFNAVSRSILRRVAGVLASEGVTPAIKVREGEFSAWTDFESITVQYPGLDQDVRLTAATMRGMLYHEGGHVRWTTPYISLLQVAQQDMGQLEWDRLLQAVQSLQGRDHHQAWNALEDQRMETAVVSDSPRKAGYFVPVILTRLASTPAEAASNYPLLIWRRYLPRHIRVAARQAFIALHGSNGLALATAFEATITKYVTATDATTMVQAVIEMKDLLDQHRLAFDLNDSGHGQQRYRYSSAATNEIPISPDMLNESNDDDDDAGEGQPVAVEVEGESQESGTQGEPAASKDEQDTPVVASTPGESQGDDASNGDDDDDDTSDGDDGGEGESGDGNSESNDDTPSSSKDTPSKGAGSEAGDHSSTEDFQSQIDQAIAEAEAERDSDVALDGDVESFRQALDEGHSKLPVYIGGASNDGPRTIQAETVAQNIEDTFMEMTMDRQPAWVEQQRRGVLNVNRYVTRQAGDVEYFKQWTDDDQPGYNLAVSIMLDYSGSMGDSMADLAQAAYASKLACQRLGIPCTVTLWDTQATTLWDGNEQVSGLPILHSAGGTDPSFALADLDNQQFDKEQHLVMVMTDGLWDGAWSRGKRSMGGYAKPGRRFVGFGYGTSASALEARGFQDAFEIRDLMKIPKVLERILPEMA